MLLYSLLWARTFTQVHIYLHYTAIASKQQKMRLQFLLHNLCWSYVKWTRSCVWSIFWELFLKSFNEQHCTLYKDRIIYYPDDDRFTHSETAAFFWMTLPSFGSVFQPLWLLRLWEFQKNFQTHWPCGLQHSPLGGKLFRRGWSDRSRKSLQISSSHFGRQKATEENSYDSYWGFPHEHWNEKYLFPKDSSESDTDKSLFGSKKCLLECAAEYTDVRL